MSIESRYLASDISKMGSKNKKKVKIYLDKHGYGSGMESTPIGEWVNDCCVLNLDEKTDNVNDQRFCKNRKIKRFGRETHGGVCKKLSTILRKGKTFDTFKPWSDRHRKWALNVRGFGNSPYNWTDTYFDNFPTKEEDFFAGYG